MTTTTRSLFAAALLLGASSLAPSLAQASDYPRLVGSGEDMTVEYGPGPQGNVVGGGPAIVAIGGTTPSIRYLDDAQVQRRTDGLVPVLQGEGETRGITWLAPGQAPAPRLAGLMGRN